MELWLQGLHTNVIKPGLQGNKGHLVHQNTICHSNLDYEVSCETPNTGQGCVSEPSEGCKCVGMCGYLCQWGASVLEPRWVLFHSLTHSREKDLHTPFALTDTDKATEAMVMQMWPK